MYLGRMLPMRASRAFLKFGQKLRFSFPVDRTSSVFLQLLWVHISSQLHYYASKSEKREIGVCILFFLFLNFYNYNLA